jgi:hypothetical protein
VTALFIVAAWLVAATARWVWTSLRRGEQAMDETWIARNHFVGLVALVVGWVCVCGPRCGAAMDHWGKPLFSWQQHWMWQDSAPEALALADRYEDVRALQDGRRMDLPGWSDYWTSHTPEMARDRLAEGSKQVWGEFAGVVPVQQPPGWMGKHRSLRQGAWLGGAALLLLIAGMVALAHRGGPKREGVKPPSYSSPAAVLFVISAAAAYGLWYAWYVPVQSDPRFLMVLYMPVIWSFVWAAEKLISLARARGASPAVWLGWRLLLWAFTVAMAADVVLMLQGTDAAEFLTEMR